MSREPVTRSITSYLAERARASGQIGTYTLAQTSGPVIGCVIGFAAIYGIFCTGLNFFMGYTGQASFGQNDQNIQANVQKALSAYSIKSIHPSVQGGVVTLTGTVDFCRTKILADELTSGIPGVKSIWDRVEVSGPTIPDKELSKQIKNLITDRIHRLGGFGFGSISAQVHDGVVTLRGYAAPQLALPTTAAVADIPGVKNLIDHIKPVPPVEPHWQSSFEIGAGESSQ